MARTTAYGFDAPTSIEGGSPSGSIVLLPIPEPTYAAISDRAAQRGMTAAQAIAQAIDEFLRKA